MFIKINKNNMENIIVFIVSFFLFSGYYIGLSFFYIIKSISITRCYSIPLRLILVFLMIYYIKKNMLLLKKNASNLLFLIFCLLYIIKILYTEKIGWVASMSWYEYILYFLSFVFLPFLFFSTHDITKYKKEILDGVIFSGLIFGILIFCIHLDLIISGKVGRIQISEQKISPLALGYSGALTILLCLYKIIYTDTKSKEKFYLISTIFFSLIIFFLASTRGSFIVLIIGFIMFLYFSDFKIKFRLFSFLLVLTPLIFLLANKIGSNILDRVYNSIQNGDTSGREKLWSDAYYEFINNIFLGGRIEVSGIYPHNIFLEILMSTGIIGMFLFLYFFITILKKGINKTKKNHVTLIAMLIFVCGLIEHLVSGGLYGAILLFSGLGMLNFTESTVNQ